MDFHYFMAVFKEVVEKKVTDSRGRLTRLIKFTKGEAKEVAKNCIQLPAKVGYKTAKRLLNERFGDPHRITAAYHKEIKQWPQIKAGDADAHRKFQNFLTKCENIDHLQNWNVLNTEDIICMLLSKLPGSARDKWSRKVLAIRRKVSREPEMADFIQFVNDETLIVTDPVFSKEVIERYVEKKPSYKKGKISTFATGNEESPDVSIYGDERHKLEVCDKFMERTLTERIKFLVKQTFCYGCLKPMTEGHNAKTCAHRLTCTICKGNHATPLHGYAPNKTPKQDRSQKIDGGENLKNNFDGFNNDLKFASVSGKAGSKVISMCIVPVRVQHKDGKGMIQTYAMLENCSQGSFIHENLVKEIGVCGMKTILNLKTLHGERTENTMVVEGIKVAGMNDDSSWLALPKLYARKEIPVDKEETTTPAKIKEWKHLMPISNGTVQRDDLQVDLLIGANCINALEPMQIIQSEGGGPYAYKTRLGWCIVGPINCTTEEITMSCNCVAVKDVLSKLASHHFAMENSVNDISLEEMFQAMYQHDFNEPELTGASTILKCSEISCEDRKFMEIVEGGTSKKDEHYVVPLPFHDPNLVLPNNRKQAIQRLMGLKRRFVKDSKFFQDYLKFMDNLLKNGNARRSDATPSGRTWYIPHH